MDPTFHEQLKTLIDNYVHDVYKNSRSFPKEEQYGLTSQWRRASLSVALNYIEGFARGNNTASYRNFLEIAYGSLKESEYLIDFSCKEGYLPETDAVQLKEVAYRIGGMLWKTLESVRKNSK